MSFSPVRRTRQNHALEHATIHLIGRAHPQSRVAGLSYPTGFTLITNLEPETVYPLVDEALQRLKRGESHLRLHPNCGTNLMTTALLVSAVAVATLRGLSEGRSAEARFDRFTRLVLLETVALVVAAPLGLLSQAKLTTEADLSDLRVQAIVGGRYGSFNLIHVRTKGA